MDECKCCQCGNDTFWYLLSGEIRCTKCLKSYPNEFEEQIATLKAEAQELHDKYGKLWDENQRQAEEIAALTKKNKWLKEAKKFIKFQHFLWPLGKSQKEALEKHKSHKKTVHYPERRAND